MELFPEQQEVCAPYQALNPWVLQQADEPPKHKMNGDYIQENHRTVGNREPILKGPTGKLIPLRPRAKAVV